MVKILLSSNHHELWGSGGGRTKSPKPSKTPVFAGEIKKKQNTSLPKSSGSGPTPCLPTRRLGAPFCRNPWPPAVRNVDLLCKNDTRMLLTTIGFTPWFYPFHIHQFPSFPSMFGFRPPFLPARSPMKTNPHYQIDHYGWLNHLRCNH